MATHSTAQKLWALLKVPQRRDAVLLLGLLLIGMVLEMLGVGLIIPALVLMTQRDIAASYPGLAPFLQILGNPTHEQLVVAGMLALVALYAIKALFLAFLAWWQMRFVFGLQADISQRLFAGYLRQPYIFHLNRNSAQLIRNTVNEVSVFLSNGLVPGLTLLTELSVLLGISGLLLTIEPFGALLVMTTLGLVAWGFHRLTQGYLLRWGEARQFHEGLRIQYLQQGLGGAKDVKLLGREVAFLAQYELHNTGTALAGQRHATLQAFPRLCLELLAVIGLVVLVLVIIGQGKPMEALLPTLGLFAVAAFRLMPSANRILGAIQSMRYALPVIDTLHSELSLLIDTHVLQHGPPLPFRNVITLEKITFRYPSTDIPALHEICLSIPRGTAVGFIGTTGSGKSTLVDIILGLLMPDSGAVRVDGIDIQTNLRGWQDQIGYVPQSIFLNDDTLRRNIAFGLPDEEIDEVAVMRAIRAAQLEDFVNELPEGSDILVGERGIRLSGGQRQRIGIARALYHDPPVLVLDEATSSLDTVTENGVMESVCALLGDKTIIIVAHRLSTVEHCDRLFRLRRGRIVEEGETAEVLRAAVGSDG